MMMISSSAAQPLVQSSHRRIMRGCAYDGARSE
jgi:hypothetical protein